MRIHDWTQPSFALDLQEIDPEEILTGNEYIEKLIASLDALKNQIDNNYNYIIEDHYLSFRPMREQTLKEIEAERLAQQISLRSKDGREFRLVDPAEYNEFEAWRQAKLTAANAAIIDKLAENMSLPNEVHPDYLEWEKNRAAKSNG